METTTLFTAALGLTDPWYVTSIELIPDKDEPMNMELHISIDFKRGAVFNALDSNDNILCDAEGKPIEYKAHDTVERIWRHLNFFQHKTFIHARVPRITTGGKCLMVNVPWARKHSGFTLLFEAMVLEYAKSMTVAVLAKLISENDKRLWTIITHYVNEARNMVDESDVTMLGMDETSRKGHNYISIIADLNKRNVLFVTEGKDSSTIDKFVEDFKLHNGDPDNIKLITCDMSLGFERGVKSNFPNAETVVDKFHVIKHANEAVDKVRKEEAKTNSDLKKTKYLWLKNESNLTEHQREKMQKLSSKHLKVARAYSMRVELQDIYESCTDRDTAEQRINKLCSWMMHSRLAPMKEFCGLIKRHLSQILNYFENCYTNAILEGINSVVQNIKTRARGFRNIEYFKTMIYLVCGNLPMDKVLVLSKA